MPGSGIFGDAADAIPPGWQYNPEKDKARRGRLKLPQKAQQQRQKQQKQKPHEVHEAVVDAASAALHAGKVEVPARDAAAAADAAGKAAGKQQAAQQAAETSSAAPAAATKQPTAAASQQPAPQAALAEQPGELHFRQAEQEPTQPAAVIQLGGGQDPHAAASRGTGTAVAAASLQPVAKPLPSAPAALVDGSTAQRRPVVGATAAVIGGVCASVAATAMALVLYRIRQRRAGFAPLATGEPRPHHHHGGGNHRHSRGGLPVSTAHLPPIPESPMAEADP